MNRLLCAILMVLTVCLPSSLRAETRRHFIILQDNSGSYYSAASRSAIPVVQNAVISLFNNESPENGYSLLCKEMEQGITFFDASQDEITFLWFVADQKGNVDFDRRADSDFKAFEDYFFTPGSTPSFKASPLGVELFFKDNFSKRPKLNSFPNGFFQVYSFTSLAYPLCLDVIKTDYCQEYIIIIISDFRTGSTFGNRQDEKLFRQVFRDKSDGVLNRASQLRGQFVTIDFYDFLYRDLGYYAFKIRPNAGSPNPENIEVRSNSNITLNQAAFGSDRFSLQESEVMFNHSDDLVVDEVGVEVLLPSGGGIYRDVTGLTDCDEGTYTIHKVRDLVIPGLAGAGDYTSELRYAFKARYVLGNKDSDASIKYAFDTTRSLDRSNFNLKTKLTPFQMGSLVLGIILFLGLLLAAYLYRKGKPRGILLHYSRFNDSYETVDFSPEGSGKVHTDYRSWTTQDDQNGFELKVEGKFDYQDPDAFYNWGGKNGFPVRVYPRIKSVPGFSVYLSSDTKTSNSDDIPVEIDSFSDGKFSFSFKFRKTSHEPLVEPVKFEVGAYLVSANPGLMRFELDKVMKRYEFHVGPDFGNVWLGVDPGTTGSCIAVGTSRNDVTIETDADGKDVISPSVILIRPDGLTDASPASIRRNTLFGAKADAIRSEKLLQNKFISIKKLLGYHESFNIGNGLTVQSSFLSTLLIEGLMKQLQEFVLKNEQVFPQFFSKGRFAPLRAAFAIPNNFTAAKIEQLKSCIQDVEVFDIKDIRFIYEAEAIIVNYLNSSNSSESKQRSPEGETLFIFDMGGATINATLANVKQRKENKGWVYEIDIISKLGYGIGGDTIDYAYLKWIFSKKNRFRILAENDPFVVGGAMGMVQRRKLKDEVLKLKKSTISNYRNNKQNLIERIDLTRFNQYNLELLDDVSDPFVQDCLNTKSSFLYSQFFEEYVWSNIRDIISDILLICSEKSVNSLDTVIMSGRSSHFPRVKDVVEESIKKKFLPKFILLELEESKSAVARGACFYGTQNSRIKLENMTTNGVFGVVQTLSPTAPSRFIKLIGDSMDFKDGIVSGEKSIEEGQDFIYDGRRVRFCQVMGVNPDAIIAKNEKHKYTEIASIMAQPLPIQKVSITVSDKDKVQCAVVDVDGEAQPYVESTVSDSDIMACNDEQYTFFVKQS